MNFFAGLGIVIVFVAIAMVAYTVVFFLVDMLGEHEFIRALCAFTVIALVGGIFFATFIIDPESYGYAKIEKIEIESELKVN